MNNMTSLRCIVCGRRFAVESPYTIAGETFCPEGHELDQYKRNLSEEFGSIDDLRSEYNKTYEELKEARVLIAHLRGAITTMKRQKNG